MTARTPYPNCFDDADECEREVNAREKKPRKRPTRGCRNARQRAKIDELSRRIKKDRIRRNFELHSYFDDNKIIVTVGYVDCEASDWQNLHEELTLTEYTEKRGFLQRTSVRDGLNFIEPFLMSKYVN